MHRFKRHFFNDNRGSVSIEFIFASMFLLIIFAFMVDLVVLRSTMGKLDRTSNSLVNILRERTQFYSGNAEINSEDVANFKKLAGLMINSDRAIGVYLERWGEEQNGKMAIGDPDCRPAVSLRERANLSPRSEISNTRRIPLYQVTLCTETHSLFRSMIMDKENRVTQGIRSSSLAVSR
ncbi:tight adherence pilus pseudopilin TadF [Pasteurella testudinis]|uniref:tight adherence pilus pseudopilin TadF n=1 Tax=Pasteurella testudinis TaxID=761 RepID=UPI004057E3BC